jgi:hypothetical protein
MRLRTTSEYIQALRAVLPDSETGAMDYAIVAQQTAGRLGLSPTDLETTRPNGIRRTSQHRSTLSETIFRLKRSGLVRAAGSRRKKSYWIQAPTRYAGTQPRPTNEQIAQRAYEIFAARGYTHGSHEQDWLQAERELLG